MPKGLVRDQQAGCFHFATFSCYRRQPYLGAAAARSLLERSLEAMRKRYLFVVGGYVAMPEYVHLLVSEPGQALLSNAIQALKLMQFRRLSCRFRFRAATVLSGRHGTTISTGAARRSVSRNSGTSTAIRLCAAGSRNRKTGGGRAFGTTQKARRSLSRSSRNGRPYGVGTGCRSICATGKRLAEVRALPGPKTRKWGTQSSWQGRPRAARHT